MGFFIPVTVANKPDHGGSFRAPSSPCCVALNLHVNDMTSVGHVWNDISYGPNYMKRSMLEYPDGDINTARCAIEVWRDVAHQGRTLLEFKALS
jgi:hypothetical protein